MSEVREKIFEIISSDWPIHATEIADRMGYDVSTKEAQRTSVSKVKYHVDQLARHEKIKIKKIGQALVSWPQEVEKLRMMHELMRGL